MSKKFPLCIFNLDNLHLLSGSSKFKLKTAVQFLTKRSTPHWFLYKNSNSELNKLQTSEYLNDFFQISSQNSSKIKPYQIFFPYDYLKEQISSYSLNNPHELILFGGDEQKVEQIAEELKFPNYLSMSEYCNLFPFLVPISKRTTKNIASTKAKVIKRIPFLAQMNFDYPFPIKAVFFLEDATDWEEYGQVITDLLSTKNGKIAHKFAETAPEEHIPIYFTSSELYSIDKKGNEILGLGGMQETLNTCYRLIYKKNLTFNQNAHVMPEKQIMAFMGFFFMFYGVLLIFLRK